MSGPGPTLLQIAIMLKSGQRPTLLQIAIMLKSGQGPTYEAWIGSLMLAATAKWSEPAATTAE